MALFFSLFVTLGVMGGIYFPGFGAESLPYNFPLLAILMFVSGWNYPAAVWKNLKIAELAKFQFFTWIFFPVIQFAIASVLIQDELFRWGFFFSAILPLGIVIPQYAERWGENANQAFVGMLLSVLLFPLLTSILWLFWKPPFNLELRVLCLNIITIGIAPYFIALLLRQVLHLPPIPQNVLMVINPILIGLLVWILLGAGQSKIIWRTVSNADLIGSIFVAISQNFIPVLFYYIFRKNNYSSLARVSAFSCSLRNNALGAGFLFFFSPKAAMPVIFVFFAHAVLFFYLGFGAYKFERKQKKSDHN